MGRYSLALSLCWHRAAQESCRENRSLCYAAIDLERAAAEEGHERLLCNSDVFLLASIASGVAAVARISIVSLTVLKMPTVNILSLIFHIAVSYLSASG